jgi:hypothetical protein
MVLVLLLDNHLLPRTAPIEEVLVPPFALAQVLRKPADAVTICRVHDSILSSGSRSTVRCAQASVEEPLATNQQ